MPSPRMQSAIAGSSRRRASVSRSPPRAKRATLPETRTAVETGMACGPATQTIAGVPSSQCGSSSTRLAYAAVAPENVQLMERIVELWNAGDWDGVFAYYDDDVVFEDGLLPDGGTYRGIEDRPRAHR